MSQKGVEALIGRLLTDQDLRRRFFREPVDVCVKGSFDVTVREIEAILGVEEAEIEELSRQLDPRIIRATDDSIAGGIGALDDGVDATEESDPSQPDLRRILRRC